MQDPSRRYSIVLQVHSTRDLEMRCACNAMINNRDVLVYFRCGVVVEIIARNHGATQKQKIRNSAKCFAKVYFVLFDLCNSTGALKSRDLTSRDLTTRHHIARVDIARLVSVFE